MFKRLHLNTLLAMLALMLLAGGLFHVVLVNGLSEVQYQQALGALLLIVAGIVWIARTWAADPVGSRPIELNKHAMNGNGLATAALDLDDPNVQSQLRADGVDVDALRDAKPKVDVTAKFKDGIFARERDEHRRIVDCDVCGNEHICLRE